MIMKGDWELRRFRKNQWGYHNSRGFSWINNLFDEYIPNKTIYRYFSVEPKDPTLKCRPAALMMIECRPTFSRIHVSDRKGMTNNSFSNCSFIKRLKY